MNRNEINFNFVSTYENKQSEKQLQDVRDPVVVVPSKRYPDIIIIIVYTDDM